MTALVTGCENFHISKKVISEDGTATYDTPKKIGELVAVTATNNYSEGNKYASNIKIKEVKKLNSVALGVTLANLSSEDDAIIMGNTYSKGETVANTEDKQSEIAVLFDITRDDGTKKYYVYYNCKLARDAVEGSTETDSIEFKDIILNGTALPDDDKNIFFSLDSADKDADKTKIENWYKTVQKPGTTTTEGA